MAEWIDAWKVQSSTKSDHLVLIFSHGFVKKGCSTFATFTDGRREVTIPRDLLCTSKKEALAKAREAARIILADLDRQAEEAEKE